MEFPLPHLTGVVAQDEKMPLGRWHKLRLESQNRIITGFIFDKRWKESTMYNKIKNQFPEDCRNIEFKFSGWWNAHKANLTL